MKTIGNLFVGIFGILMIFFGIYSLLGFSDSQYDNETMISGVIFGSLLIWISSKKDKKTAVDHFIEKERITITLWWKRLIGFVVDFTIIMIVYSLTINVINEIYGARIDRMYHPVLLISPFILFLYSLQEYVFNTSIGKTIFNLKIVSAKTNGKPTFIQIVVRSLIRLIPFDAFFYISKRPVGLHDVISNTLVIRKNEK